MASKPGVFKVSGIPVPAGLGFRFANPWSTHYFVDYDNGSNSNDGITPATAWQTITYAEANSVGGDVIYVRPRAYQNGQGYRRYTEDVTFSQDGTTAGGVDANAGKSLIGICNRQVPNDFLGVRWKYASATPLTINTPGTHVENIGFFAEDATYVVNMVNAAPATSGGTGTSFYNCSFKGDADFYANGIDGCSVINCQFQAKYNGAMGGINYVGSQNQVKRPIIKGCHFIGGNANNMATAPIQGAAPWLDALISDCYFHCETDENLYINIAGTTNTGLIANCYFAIDDVEDNLTNLQDHASGMFAVACYDENGCVDFSS